METLYKILEWARKLPPAGLLLLLASAGCLLGLILLGLGATGGFSKLITLQGPQQAKSTATGKWILIPSLILLVVVVIVQTSAGHLPFRTFLDYVQISLILCALALTLYLVRQVRTRTIEFRKLPSDLKTQINEEVSKVLGESSVEIKKETDSLVAAEKILVTSLDEATKRLVASVEDATRHVLNGIPEIFDRALQLVAEADGELWFVNFALNFGQCHTEVIQEEYSKLPMTSRYKALAGADARRNFGGDNGDAKKFLTLLEAKVFAVPRVNILTVSDQSIKPNFLIPLYERAKYRKLFMGSDKKLNTEARTNRIQTECQNIVDAKDSIMKELGKRPNPLWKNIEHAARFYEATSLPIQVVIAGKPDGEKSGCLVFMVGTEILRAATSDSDIDNDEGADAFSEPGFYTELPEVVDVYKSLVEALIKQAKADYNNAGSEEKQKRRPPFDGV